MGFSLFRFFYRKKSIVLLEIITIGAVITKNHLRASVQNFIFKLLLLLHNRGSRGSGDPVFAWRAFSPTAYRHFGNLPKYRYAVGLNAIHPFLRGAREARDTQNGELSGVHNMQ